MAGALKKIEEGVGTGATALTAKTHLVQASDATARAATVTGAAEASKGKGIAGKAGKTVVAKASASRAGQKVAKVAAARAPAAMPGLISKVASTPGLATAGKVVGGLARFAPWVAGANAAIGAVRGGYESFEKGGSALDVAKGAAWGAADQVTAGLASWAYGKGTQVAKGLGNAIVPAAQAQEAGVGNKPSSSDARSTLQGIGDKQLSGTLPSPALGRTPAGTNERAVGNMLDKASTAHARVEEVRERRARGDNGPLLTGEKLSNAKARERAATIELGKQGVKEGTDSYHEGMQQMRAGKVPKRERSDGRGQVNWGLPSNGGADTQRGSSLAPDQSRAFNAASQHYADSHMTGEAQQKQPPTYGPNGDGRRGFAIPKVQAAAQAAKGNQYDGPEE